MGKVASSGNRLLPAIAAVHPQAYRRIEARLEPVAAAPNTLLNAAGEMPPSVYFVDTGVVSVIAQTRSGDSLELGTVGTEGMTNAMALQGGERPPYGFVTQLPLTARRLSMSDARELLIESCRDILSVYSQFVTCQVAQSALCARFHTASQRLSRWILLTHLKSNSVEVPLTHESLSRMVGAPRSQVTEAIGILRDAGGLASTRGRVTVISAERMREHACECFETERLRLRAFERHIVAWIRTASLDVSGHGQSDLTA